MDQSLVQIKNVSKHFPKLGRPALDRISADIPQGKILGLVGPDAAGKTTLIRLIAGLLKPTEGHITVSQFDTMKQAEQIHNILGYMPQKFGLYDELSVQQNLNLYADLQGVIGEERKDAFKKLLEFTALAPFTDRLAGNLSGGMKQKLGLACALLHKPILLLLDEPSVGVDPISRRELWKIVEGLLAQGITVLWSTAYLDETERCDTVLLLNEGKLLYTGPPKDLTRRVQGRVFNISHISGSHRELLKNALNQKNVIDGVIQGSDVRIVVRDPHPPILNINNLGGGTELLIEQVPPRFEDAFIDILGGGPGGTSKLAEQTQRIVQKQPSEIVVETKNLTKKFGNFTAADHISFQVKRGEIFGLLGPNGAGKSTTFKMMCGLLKPTFGEAFVEGLDLQKASGEARSHIGYMAQKFSLYGNLSVFQNLTFFSGAYNLIGGEQREAIRQMIDIFDFKEYLDTSAESLPLGYKQRLALSCAVMHRPEVLFLDEPTSGVDPITRREFWNHINGLVEKGVTIMVTTHFMDEAEYCDRIGLVYRSQMIVIDTPDTLKKLAATRLIPKPTLEDAFIHLIEEYDRNHAHTSN